MPDLTIIILTYNESLHIARCLESARQLGVPVIVVDSHSPDGTGEMAGRLGAQVVHSAEDRFADKLNWALENLDISSEWVMRIDADEILTDDLVRNLSGVLDKAQSDVCGFYVRRQLWFMGQWMRHGGVYPTWSMRVWRRGVARCESKDLDEHMILARGTASSLKLDIIDNPLHDLGWWIEKHKKYAVLEANSFTSLVDELLLPPRFFGKAVERTRWLKVFVFNRMPLFLRPLIYFLYRYIVRLGFLDGKRGMIFHFLHGFWYRFLIDAMIFERREARSINRLLS